MKHKRSLLYIVAAIGFLLVFYVLIVKAIAPPILKSKIISAVKDTCADCDLQIDSLSIALVHLGHITLNDVSLKAGQPDRSWVDAKIQRLEIDIKITAIPSKKLVVSSLVGNGLDVTYGEGEAPKKTSPEKPDNGETLQFAIEQTQVNGLEFRYAHAQHGVTSLLHIHRVSGSMSALGSLPELKDQMTTADFQGVIEKSGHAHLKLAALTRDGPHYVDVNFEIEKQRLEDLNSFFTSNDGIVFHGEVLTAKSTVNVRDQKSKAYFQSSYKDVDFKQTATPKTSAVEAALTNLGADLLLNKTNVDRLPQDRETRLDVQREKKEALVHFILRSMKEAAIDLAKKKDSRK